MAFTYNDALPTDRDYLRSLLNDVNQARGPFPELKNFSDAELDKYLATAGTVNAAYIICCNRLAAAWSSHAREVWATALKVNAREVAKNWREQAAEARKNPVDGTRAAAFRVFNATVD